MATAPEQVSGSWAFRHLGDQRGRIWLITGGTNGIGLEVARAAALAGASLILPARRRQRAHAVANHLRGLMPVDSEATITVADLDLADLNSVHRFCDSVGSPIDILVNNAGVFSPRRQETAEGFELMIGTNYLGPFALTNLLRPHLRGRVVIVGSNAHRQGKVDAADPHFRHRRWNMAAAYAQSKLCTMMWGRALQHKLNETGGGVDVQLAHPGWAFTNLQNATGNDRLDRAVSAVCRTLAQPAADGAVPVLAAAVAALPRLTYVGPAGFLNLVGAPAPQPVAHLVRDNDAAWRVWDLGVRETDTDL